MLKNCSAPVTSGPVRDALLPEVPAAAQAGLRDLVLDSRIIAMPPQAGIQPE